MAQLLMNDIVFLAAAACCVAFLILIVVLMERYNRLRDQLVADEAVGALSPSQPATDAAMARAPGTSPESPLSARAPGGAPQVSVGTTPPTGGAGDIPAAPGGITGEHNFRAQVHELTQLLGTVTEALQHYDAERARETEKLTAAMRTLGEALAAAVRRTQSHDVGVALQSVEQKLDRVIGLLQKGGSGGS